MNIAKTYVRVRRPVAPNCNLLCCRACLATDVKLFNIHEHNLVETFTRISGIAVAVDKLPQHLCSWCVALLRRCASFKDKCARAKLCLLPGLMKRELTTEYVRSIDRFANRLVDIKRTKVQIIACLEDDDDCQEDSKQEFEIEIKENITGEKILVKDEIIQMEIEIDDNITPNVDLKDVNIENEIIDLKERRIEKTECQIINDVDNLNIKKKQTGDDKRKEYNINNDVPGVTIVNIDQLLGPRNVSKTAVKVPAKKRIRQRKKNTGEKVKRIRKKKRKVYRTPENDYTPNIDFEEFETANGVKIITLTKEEQLKEIEMRKNLPKYIEAKYRCENCGKYFNMPAAYKNHQAKHEPSKGAFACMICSLHFRTNANRMMHQERHRFKMPCQQCPYISRAWTEARNHYTVRHSGKGFKCSYCEQTFKQTSKYRTHMRVSHSTSFVACALCGAVFSTRVGLRLHTAMMHAVQPSKCDVCSASFISLDALKRHTDTAGSHQGLHPCPQCGDNWGSEEQLRKHAGESHPKCDKCSATFIDHSSYRRHTRMHEPRARRPPAPEGGRGSAPAVCDVCGKTVKNPVLLRYHQQITHGPKPYACTYCPKAFSDKHYFQSHLRTHTGEKPFQCNDCPLAFNLKGNLARHILNIHMGVSNKSPCDICGRLLATPATVRLHIRRVHGGEPWPKRHRPKRDKSK